MSASTLWLIGAILNLASAFVWLLGSQNVRMGCMFISLACLFLILSLSS